LLQAIEDQEAAIKSGSDWSLVMIHDRIAAYFSALLQVCFCRVAGKTNVLYLYLAKLPKEKSHLPS
jgi:hypothetical protein